MTEINRQEIIGLALSASVNLRMMEEECWDFIEDRRATLQDRLRKVEASKVGPIIEEIRERLRAFDNGSDFQAAFHSIAARVLGDIAKTFRGKGPGIPGQDVLRALQKHDVPPLQEKVQAPDDFDARNEIRLLIANRLTMRAMDEYEELHAMTIQDTDGAIYFSLRQEVNKALAELGL